MVLLHLKQADDRQFLFEVPASECIDTVTRDIVTVSNLQMRILHLIQECQQLALHGPAKLPSQENDDDSDEDEEPTTGSNNDVNKIINKSKNTSGASSSKLRKERGPFYNKDPSGRRTGEGILYLFVAACDPMVAETLKKTLAEAETSVSKDQVDYKVPLTAPVLKEVIQNIKGAVMICYPMGLPRHDPVGFVDKDALNPATAQLWWAGKQLAF